MNNISIQKSYSSFDSNSSIEGQHGNPDPEDTAKFDKAMQEAPSEGQDPSDSAGACNTANYEINLIHNQGQQDNNGYPILYTQAPSNQEIEVSIKNSGSTFESRLQYLTPQQQAQVKEDLANFTTAYDKAMAASQNVGDLNAAIKDGAKLMDTMNNIDPELAETCPDLGENLENLEYLAMQQVSRAHAEIQ